MIQDNQDPNQMIQFIQHATSPFHVVKKSISLLEAANFTRLDLSKPWKLEKGNGYFVCPYDSELFAFQIGENFDESDDFRIIAAHTDHPCLKIKPNPGMQESDYLKINTQIYGGPILNTWLDRPLSIAGKVTLKSNHVLKPEIRLLDVKDPILTIPNLAIHMNRDINNGTALNKQTDMIPLAAMVTETFNKDNFFINYIAKQLQVNAEDILDFDLYVYNTEEGQIIGMNQEFLSSPRLDNLTSVYAAVKGITSSTRKNGMNMIALFDNEEIGSRTKQGADSTLLSIILEKIYDGLELNHIRFYEAITRSLLVSTDVGHALHPNKPDKNDPTNLTMFNHGIIIKIDGNQKYAFDTEVVGILMQLCEANHIPYQKSVNRSDMPGGSTLGSIASSLLPIKTADIGVPLLAMHSARELMGIKDQTYLEQLIKAIFTA